MKFILNQIQYCLYQDLESYGYLLIVIFWILGT